MATSKEFIAPRFRVYSGDKIVLGPGKAQILAHVAETGSLSEAARLMEMSYTRAWTLVKLMNESFSEPLIESVRGGSSGGGAMLTKTGQKVLALYQQMQSEAQIATKANGKKLIALLKREAEKPAE
jgi:molybdate transport system regulatory protein